MSNKNFLNGLPLLIEFLDIPDDIKDKLWEVYYRYEDETNPQKQYDALIRIHSLINRAKIKQEEKYQRIIAEIFDEPKSLQSSGLYCFICSDDNSYSPFGYNNINTKKSEFHEILKEIIEMVFFKNHVILQFVGKEENNTDSKPSKL